MAKKAVVKRVWIDVGCIACDSCAIMCPDVFDVQEESCVIRPEAMHGEFTKARTDLIRDAAEECPVQVIKFETDEEEEPEDEELSRRGVITAAGVGWLAFGGAAAITCLGAGRFVLPNVLEEPDPTLSLGESSGFTAMSVGTVSDEFRSQGIWIVRLADRIVALSTACTHLGCLTNWMESERKFRCPCHGSAFLREGVNVEGPAPRALDRFRIWDTEGAVFVDRSRRFQYEKGEWNDSDSYLST